MCQDNSKRIHQKSVKCYRVYSNSWSYDKDKFTSYFYDQLMPEIGVPTKASFKPFHGYRHKKDVKAFFRGISRDESIVFECVLTGKLQSGHWSCDIDIKTCTGNILTLVRKVATYNYTTHKLTWDVTA